ncbi:MAG: phage major capsid protein [Gemmatimonadales bacterium]|nr:MAG: phage major capsid protein [Gemmatimonadales bacterium]
MSIEQKRRDLAALYRELEAGQKEMEAGPIPQNRGEELDQKAKEAETLQTEVEQYERISGLAANGKRMGHVPLPRDEREAKAEQSVIRATPGELFVASQEFQTYKSNGKQGWSGKVDVSNLNGRPVGLKGEAATRFMEAKTNAIPVLGTDAIIPFDRDPEVVRFEEPEILNLRQLFGSLPTTSDTVHYVRHSATNRGAAAQDGRGAAKGYLSVEFAPATTPVQTIPVLSKIAEQDIDDAARLVQIINGEMDLDIRVETERQLLWGSGDDGELEGIFEVGVPEFDRAQQDDTLIDTVRRMRTDLRVNRVIPTALAIHPLDWEEIELEKGSDDRYVWAVIQTVAGPRIWSLPVVEVDSMENEDGVRRMLMGDFTRGATVYDRNMVRLAVGYVNDDFEKNLRTLRAEQRLAFAVKRDYAFSFTETATPTPTAS